MVSIRTKSLHTVDLQLNLPILNNSQELDFNLFKAKAEGIL
jgi:hypothetical protein